MTEVKAVNYGGHTLSKTYVTHLIKQGISKKVPPSLFISQLYYESNWGNSQVARDNNNWGGLTWNGKPNRPSGIVVSQGTSRPSNEGGYYMKFKSVNDYLTDYVYLITDQGIYNIQGHKTFETSVRGLFKVGGAKYDYAAVGATAYVNTMVSIRNGLNKNNNDFMTKIDNNPKDYVDGTTPSPDPNPPVKPDVPDINLGNILTFFEDFTKKIVKNIEKMLIVNLFDYGQSKTLGNSFLKVDKTYANMQKIKPTLNFNKLVDDLLKSGNKEMAGIITKATKDITDTIGGVIDDMFDDLTPNPEPNPDPDPSPSNKMYFPINPKDNGINFWVPPNQPNMDYGGARKGRRHWAYDIGTLGNANVKCHAVRAGEVLEVSNPLGIIIIKHSSDSYYTQYMHLNINHFKVKKGDKVKAGQQIGVLGGTGGYKIHLHIAVSKNGTFATEKDTINPRTYLKVTGNNKTDLPSPT